MPTTPRSPCACWGCAWPASRRARTRTGNPRPSSGWPSNSTAASVERSGEAPAVLAGGGVVHAHGVELADHECANVVARAVRALQGLEQKVEASLPLARVERLQ